MEKGKLVVAEIMADLISRNGAETFFVDLVREMATHDEIELHVIALYDKIDPTFEELRHTPNLRFYTLGKKKGIDFACARRLRKLIRSIKPDIVHGHRAYLATYWLAFGRRKQPFSLVHTCHNVIEPYDQLKKFFYRRHLLTFVALSEVVEGVVRTSFPNARIETIYNGIRLPKIPNEEKQYDFICIAAFRPVKNHRLLIDAFEEYWKEHKDATLVCLGIGDLLEETKAYVASRETGKNIFFFGLQPNVYSYLARSKVFVLSSDYEGTPVSILEAMNAGLPIACTNVGGIPDMVKEGVNGFMCNPKDAHGLYEAMKNAMERNPENIIGKRNQEDVQRFNVAESCSNYLKLFFDIRSNVA